MLPPSQLFFFHVTTLTTGVFHVITLTTGLFSCYHPHNWSFFMLPPSQLVFLCYHPHNWSFSCYHPHNWYFLHVTTLTTGLFHVITLITGIFSCYHPHNWSFFMLPPSQLVFFHVTTLTTGLFSCYHPHNWSFFIGVVNVHIRPSFSGEIYKQTVVQTYQLNSNVTLSKQELWIVWLVDNRKNLYVITFQGNYQNKCTCSLTIM